jgi:hypothetical protein
MNFSTLVDRVRFEFMEMPGLELTMAQAVRLWNMGADDCRHVIDALVDSGFLRWTAKRTIVRSGRSYDGMGLVHRDISVASVEPALNPVG